MRAGLRVDLPAFGDRGHLEAGGAGQEAEAGLGGGGRQPERGARQGRGGDRQATSIRSALIG